MIPSSCKKSHRAQRRLLHLCAAACRWMNDFEGNLLSLPVSNLTGGSWLDVPAAIDYFIITEITKNPGGFNSGFTLHVLQCALPECMACVHLSMPLSSGSATAVT